MQLYSIKIYSSITNAQMHLTLLNGNHLAERRQGTLQFKANLAVAACQKDFHDQALYCLPTQFW